MQTQERTIHESPQSVIDLFNSGKLSEGDIIKYKSGRKILVFSLNEDDKGVVHTMEYEYYHNQPHGVMYHHYQRDRCGSDYASKDNERDEKTLREAGIFRKEQDTCVSLQLTIGASN